MTRVSAPEGHEWRDLGRGRWSRVLLDGTVQTVNHPVKPLDTFDVPVVEGRKDDAGKDPWDLAPWDAFRAIVGVLGFGARKYGRGNWEGGMAWSRLYAATFRHLTAWWNGERTDPETGLSHLAHAACCVCFLIAFEIRGIGTDDRPAPTRVPRFPG